MAKKRVKLLETEQDTGDSPSARKPPRTAAGCRAYMRSELTRGFPEIVEGFVKVAKRGSAPHLKMANEILESGRVVKAKRSKATSALLKKMAEI